MHHRPLLLMLSIATQQSYASMLYTWHVSVGNYHRRLTHHHDLFLMSPQYEKQYLLLWMWKQERKKKILFTDLELAWLYGSIEK